MRIKIAINQEVIFENHSTAMVTEDNKAKRLICSPEASGLIRNRFSNA